MAERMFKMGDKVVVTGDTAGRDHEFDVGTVGEVSYVYEDGDCEVRTVGTRWIVGGDDLEPCRLSSLDTVKEGGDIIQNVDMVNHPPHYTSDPSGVECIEVTRHRTFNVGNAIKYLWRAGLKGDESKTIEDLKKSVFYINDEIARLESAGS